MDQFFDAPPSSLREMRPDQSKPFRKANRRKTYFGATSQMKRSQWVPLPQLEKSSSSAVVPTEELGHFCGGVGMGPGPCGAGAGPASHNPGRTLGGAWKPGAWGAGSSLFGSASFQGLSDAAVKRRVATLQRGVNRASAEASALKNCVQQGLAEHRAFVLAEHRQLDQELEVAKTELARREQRGLRRRPRQRRVDVSGSQPVYLPAGDHSLPGCLKPTGTDGAHPLRQV